MHSITNESVNFQQDEKVEKMEFPGVLKKKHVEILGFNEKRSGISRVVQEKLMWNIHGFLFLTLGSRSSRGESLFSSKFLSALH